MRVFLQRCAFMLVLSATAYSENSVNIPWSEFRAVYAEHILHQNAEPTVESVAVINDAHYRVDVNTQYATATITFQGTVVSGSSAIITAFPAKTTIREIDTVDGATVFVRNGAIHVKPVAPDTTFGATMTILIPVKRSGRYLDVVMPALPSLRNALALTLPPNIVAVSHPGIRENSGTIYFNPTDQCVIRLRDDDASAMDDRPIVDIFTTITVHAQQLVLTTYCVPVHVAEWPITMHIPPGTLLLPECVRDGYAQQSADGTVKILSTTTPGIPVALSMRRPFTDIHKPQTLRLPYVDDNQGRSGDFAIIEPSDTAIRITGNGINRHQSISQLPDTFTAVKRVAKTYQTAVGDEPLTLTLKSLRPVSAPTIVLQELCVYTAFEETGGVLSIIRITTPKSLDSKLPITGVSSTTVWSLKVNGNVSQMFEGNNDTWFIPIPTNQVSTIELALLQRGERLRLSGRLDTVIPGIGLPADRLLFAVGLPRRVELLSIEGAITPTSNSRHAPLAKSFQGNWHYFQRPFYDGQPISTAVFYKEPVND